MLPGGNNKDFLLIIKRTSGKWDPFMGDVTSIVVYVKKYPEPKATKTTWSKNSNFPYDIWKVVPPNAPQKQRKNKRNTTHLKKNIISTH